MKKPIEEYVRSIPDFPEKGIIFRDVTSILEDADGLQLAIDLMQEKIGDTEFDVVVGPESRGFILEYRLHIICINRLFRFGKRKTSMRDCFDSI